MHDAYHVQPADKALFGGEDSSDVYVKAWLKGCSDSAQETDVHYRAQGGEANFNWRLVFPLEYCSSDQVMIIKRRVTKNSLFNLSRTSTHRFTFLALTNNVHICSVLL